MLWNLFLMLIWAALSNDFSPFNLLMGFMLGFAVLALLSARGVMAGGRYVRRTRRVISFVAFYLYDVVMSNIRVAIDVLHPNPKFVPAIVAVPLESSTDSEAEITLLANLLTLTPGTMSVDVSLDRRTLYVHTIDLPNGDPDAFRARIKNELERRVLEVLH